MPPNHRMEEAPLPDDIFNIAAATKATSTLQQEKRWMHTPRQQFLVGIIVASPHETVRGDHIMALTNAASPCVAKVIAMLSGDDATEWCRRHKMTGDDDHTPELVHGPQGLKQVLQNEAVDGVYITGVFGNKVNIIEQALRAGKHVLADDPITTSAQEYCRLLNLAHECRCHLQDTTMFLYHHAVREFLTAVLNKEQFGEIRKVDACFDINPKDSRFRGVIENNNAKGRRGCVGDLCRYCAVMGTLVFSRLGLKALSAQVVTKSVDDRGLPDHAFCVVNFEGGARLTVDSSYVRYAATRQSVDIHSESHSASMSDFVFSSHSLACYRLYKKSVVNGKAAVEEGESIDLEGGPLPEVSVWIRFAELASNAYHEDETEKKENKLFNRYDFSYSAVQSQNIVSALMESLRCGCKEVKVAELDLDIPIR